MADVDHDGVVSAADRPVAGAVVFWETAVHAITDGEGRFDLDVPRPGIVWVRTPEGFSPAPSWREVRAGQSTLSLLLSPMNVEGPLRFVHATDTHLGTSSEAEARRAFEQAASSHPWFLVLTGDLTSGTNESEFDSLAAALRGIGVPLVPVVGNHDWHDGGARYRRRLGPPMHSFDAGGVHFIALNFMVSEGEQLEFIDRDLAARPPHGLVVVLTHGTPSHALAAAFAGRGVDDVFTGHSHENRVMERGSLLEVNTETAVMGGIDYTPAGYRVVELRAGRFALAHHTVVEEPLVAVSFPRPHDCVPPGRVPVIAAVELGSAPARVELSLDGGRPAPLAPAGGWAYTGELTLTRPGWYSVEVRAVSTSTSTGGRTASSRFCIVGGEGGAQPAPPLPDWPMLQGSPEHRGFVATELAPPLRPIWARAVGGHVRAGAPALAGGRLFVPVVDLADSRAGGLVALDAQSGRLLWEERGLGSVAASPAVAAGAVVFATTDGWLHAHRAEDGARLWAVDLAADREETASSVYSPPVIAEGRVYAASQGRLAVLDLASGAVVDSAGASSITCPLHSGAAVSAGRVVVPLGRGTGSLLGFALDGGRLTGRWSRSYPASTRIEGAPIIDGGVVYAGNAEAFLSALDLETGEPRWTSALYSSWSMWNLATPALAHGLLFVATPHEYLFAIDAATGQVKWKRAAGKAVTHPVPYQREARGFLASPVVTGRLVWAGGIDGVLRAFDAVSGEERWKTDLALGAFLVSRASLRRRSRSPTRPRPPDRLRSPQ